MLTGVLGVVWLGAMALLWALPGPVRKSANRPLITNIGVFHAYQRREHWRPVENQPGTHVSDPTYRPGPGFAITIILTVVISAGELGVYLFAQRRWITRHDASG